jgi:hypothetical protein
MHAANSRSQQKKIHCREKERPLIAYCRGISLSLLNERTRILTVHPPIVFHKRRARCSLALSGVLSTTSLSYSTVLLLFFITYERLVRHVCTRSRDESINQVDLGKFAPNGRGFFTNCTRNSLDHRTHSRQLLCFNWLDLWFCFAPLLLQKVHLGITAWRCCV